MPIIPTAGNDTLVGTPGADRLSGFDGDDVLVGGSGRDVFVEGYAPWTGPTQFLDDGITPYLVQGESYEFGHGNDRIFGGRGFDRLDYSLSSEPIQMFAGRGVVRMGEDQDRFKQIELVTLTQGDDRVSGGLPTMGVRLMGGDDRLWMTEGVGGYLGGGGVDTVLALEATGQVIIDLGGGPNLIAGGEVVLFGFENVLGATEARNILTGNAKDNILSGGLRADWIDGRSGQDRIEGGDGNDNLFGGRGADEIIGNGGDDKIRDHHGTGTYYGGDGDDKFITRAGAVFGDDGDDLIVWRPGARDAEVTGGDGADVFKFTKVVADSARTILDFDPAVDRLDIPGVSALSDVSGFVVVADVLVGLIISSVDPADLSVGLTITLNGLTPADLTDEMFL